jgi:hypothetical protein
VDARNCSGGWCEVSFSGGVGYASRNYLAFAGGVPGVAVAEPVYTPYAYGYDDDYYDDGPGIGFYTSPVFGWNGGWHHRWHGGHHAGNWNHGGWHGGHHAGNWNHGGHSGRPGGGPSMSRPAGLPHGNFHPGQAVGGGFHPGQPVAGGHFGGGHR